jgi:probable F420-dependent oxidoreductase
MEVGVVFPQTEIGSDPARIREYARRTERLGFEHLLAYDHVLGVDPGREDWTGSFDNDDAFHEPFVLFSRLAAVTERLSFVTGVLVAPQRQTALVAKQAAEVAVLSRGRLRLSVGVGWNEPEYEALAADFGTRGARVEEQIELCRRLWTEPVVEYDGEFHAVDGLGINPRPDEPPPVWIGGAADPVLDRVVRRGDGWLPPSGTPADLSERLERLWEFAARRDRPREKVGLHPRVRVDPTPDVDPAGGWVDGVAAWRDHDPAPAYLAVDPTGGDPDPDDHLDRREPVADALADRGLL